jgi:hypothetical protein
MVQGVVVEDGFILDVNPASGELIEKVAHSEKRSLTRVSVLPLLRKYSRALTFPRLRRFHARRPRK